jgi:flagellar protein FliO/FliZ
MPCVAAQQAPVDPLPAGSVLQLTLGLVAVLLAIGASVWLVRRLGRLQGMVGSGLRVLGGLSLGARERVVLVQVGDQQLLLGVAPGRVQTLHVLEQPLSEPRRQSDPGSFGARLQAALGRGGVESGKGAG